MLFISRVVKPSWDCLPAYVVADTDDGVEEVHTRESLGKRVKGTKTPISGVEVAELHDGKIKYIRGINIFPCTAMQSQAVMQLKAKTGVEVILYNGMISAINWDSSKLPAGCKIVLSQFGKKFGDDVFMDKLRAEGGQYLTFVLDDSLDFSPATFQFYERRDRYLVKFDIRNLGEDKARVIYNCMYRSGSSKTKWYQCIIDSKQRKEMFLKEMDARTEEYLAKKDRAAEIAVRKRLAELCMANGGSAEELHSLMVDAVVLRKRLASIGITPDISDATLKSLGVDLKAVRRFLGG